VWLKLFKKQVLFRARVNRSQRTKGVNLFDVNLADLVDFTRYQP
jgi:hypothetical protein